LLAFYAIGPARSEYRQSWRVLIMNDRRLEGTLSSTSQSGTNGSAHANGHAVASTIESQAATLERAWATDPRWAGIERTYTAADVVKLRGSVQEEHTLARLGAERLWSLLQENG
jgi:Isocitrate lyase family